MMKYTGYKPEVEPGVFDPVFTPYSVMEEKFPWGAAPGDQFRFLVRYASLAPSTYNTQPWEFQICPGGIAVYADYSRSLPEVDPENRELIISVGAAVFNLLVAASHFGFFPKVHYNDHGTREWPLALVDLKNSREHRNGAEDLAQLFPMIVERHTNRHPFLEARIPGVVAKRLEAIGHEGSSSLMISTDPGVNTKVAHLVAEAERRQQLSIDVRKERAGWIRENDALEGDGIPGAAFGLSDKAATVAPWVLRVLDDAKGLADKNMKMCLDAPGLVVIYGEESVESWLKTGLLLQRILLVATGDGLQCSFFNMPIEVPELRVELRRLLGLSRWPQLLLRLGYCLEEPVRTPRRPVEEVLIN